ncbi:MFS transporter, partial [Rhizobium ruizarguesonis]
DTFSVTTPQAGYVISASALGVVVCAPVIAVLAATVARRTLLLALMLIFAAGNISSAMAPTFKNFTLLRFVSGLPHGA